MRPTDRRGELRLQARNPNNDLGISENALPVDFFPKRGNTLALSLVVVCACISYGKGGK